MDKPNFWQDLYEKASSEKAMADFTVGWLMSVLRGTGMSDEEVQRHVAEARIEANNHFISK